MGIPSLNFNITLSPVGARCSKLKTQSFLPTSEQTVFRNNFCEDENEIFLTMMHGSSWHRKLFDASSEVRAPLKSRHCHIDCCNKNGCSGLQLRYSFVVWELTKY